MRRRRGRGVTMKNSVGNGPNLDQKFSEPPHSSPFLQGEPCRDQATCPGPALSQAGWGKAGFLLEGAPSSGQSASRTS